MENSVNERVRTLIDYKELSDNKFAQMIGVGQKLLSNMFIRGTEPSSKTISSILNTFQDISAEWLLRGEGDMLISEKNTNCKIDSRPRIPMTVAAGSIGGFADSIKPYDCEQIPVITAFPSYDYTMIVKGNSMEPKYEGGDEIAIKKVTDYIEWGKVYVLDTRDGAVIKRLYDSQDKYRCVSYNKEYPDFEINKADVFGVYKVVGLIRI